MAAQFYKINYKSDFVLTINSDAGWAVPFCIKFWTGMPSHGYFAGFDGENYVNCRVGETPTQLLVMFDDHHMPVGPLRMQIAYHTTIEEFPDRKFDEVTNPTNVTVDIDGTEYQVMLDFTGETGAEIDFSMPSSGVMSVNGKIGYVTLTAEDVGAQPTIEDLATIRSGAAAGATAVQPATLQEGLATKQNVIEDLATIRSGAAAGATAVQPAALQEGLATKQDVISDLATIRSGAAAGATAVQPAGLTPIENDIDTIEGKIPSAASASNQLADKAFVNSALSDKADTSDIPTALSQLSQDSTHRVVTDAEKSTWNGKQNAISDLATIRSGAAAGATAVQPAAMNTALAAKQDTLTFDNAPTANSNNPVKSSGIKTALDAKQSTISTVNVTVDNNTGTPSGSASVSGSTLSLSFQNLKGATGATGATGPQGPQGERGLPGESGVTGDVSGFTVIQTIDPSATYGATDIAGAAAVQATNQELTELAGEVGEIENKVGVIDNEPTAGSENLVKSGGIWNQTGDLSNCKLHNSWLVITGKYSINNSYKSTLIPIKAGDIIIVSKAAETSSYIAFMKSDENIDNHGSNAPLCDNEGRRVISGDDESYTAPSDANYLYVGLSNPNDTTPQKLLINGYNILKSLKENIAALQENFVELRSTLLSDVAELNQKIDENKNETNKTITNKIAEATGGLQNFFEYQNFLLSTGVYIANNYQNYKCIAIPIEPTDVINIARNESNNSSCAFLTSLDYIDVHDHISHAAALCEGTERITVESITPIALSVPNDAKYLYVGINSGVDNTPSVLEINGYDYTKTLKESYLALQEDLNEIDDLINPKFKFPTNTWDSKNFTSNTGTDGIFFDRRNKITSGRTLEKIGVKTRYAGKVKIHYLSTIPPYTEIANEVHDVLAGINEFSPTTELDYSQDFYVAFSNVSNNPCGVMLVYPTDNTGQGTKITIATGESADNTYAYALWIEVTKNRFDELENEIRELDTNGISTLDGLKKAITDNVGLIRLDGVEFTLDSPLSIPSGTKITGVRGKTIINVPSTVLKGIELNNVEDVVIENITLVGAYNGTPLKSEMQPVKPGIVDSAEDARQFVNAGYQTDLTNGGVTSTYVPQIGINIKECEKIEIIGCEIKNFSYYGIANALSGKNYRYACKFENNYINNCYCGIYIYKEAERSQYIANNVSLCQIGLYMDSGTNMFTDCAFNANRIGMFMNNGWNHAHGVQTGNAFTHCSLFSIYAYNIENGEVFSQCKFGYVDNELENGGNAIYIKNSRGLVFNNCQMIACDIKFDGKFYLHYTGKTNGTADQFANTNYVMTYEDISGQESQYNGGVNQILGCSYISGLGTITLSSDLDATNVLMKNNFYITGQNSSRVNN